MSQFVQDIVTQAILSHDPLTEAEQMMGPAMAQTDRGKLVAASLALISNLTKNERLHQIGDTAYGATTSRYKDVIEKFGFQKAGDWQFTKLEKQDYPLPKRTVTEEMCVYGHREYGAVLVFDTTDSGEYVNDAHVYYAWKPPIHDLDERNRIRFSMLHKGGGWESPTCPDWRRQQEFGVIPGDLFWFGNQGARQALCFDMRRMAENGSFYKQWPEGEACRGMIISHYRDYTDQVNAMQPMARVGWIQHLTRKRLEECEPWLQHIVNGNV